jgi:hypothetical protein
VQFEPTDFGPVAVAALSARSVPNLACKHDRQDNRHEDLDCDAGAIDHGLCIVAQVWIVSDVFCDSFSNQSAVNIGGLCWFVA